MPRLGLLALAFLLPLAAHAADARAPVAEIMTAAENNWRDVDIQSDEEAPYDDYFREDFLTRLYSRDFVEKYRAAAKFPAYDDGDSPFDYDPIVGGQDGCALKDLSIGEAKPAAGSAREVAVSFDNTHCFGDRGADWEPTRLVFRIVEEDGRAVIDDIERPAFEEASSLKAEMVELAEYGESGGNGENAE